MNKKYDIEQEGGLLAGVEPDEIIRRFEKLPVNIYPTEEEGANYVADTIVAGVNAAAAQGKPFVLGLTTGKSPVGIYRKLLAAYRAGKVSFENVVVFSLDEFYPIAPEERQSRNFRIRAELTDHVNIKPQNIHIPNSKLKLEELSSFCRDYEKTIKDCGGIDLMLLGTGAQGQLGFNEPGSFSNSLTRLVMLSAATRKTQSNLFGGVEHTPTHAISMGLQTILAARQIILIAWGEEKSSIVKATAEDAVSPFIPASCLQQHANIEMVIDKGASEKLTRICTPWLVGTCDWQPKFIRKAVLWLCNLTQKPVLKLTHEDYLENGLGQLLETVDGYYNINIRVFNDFQHTITGWPGGKPNADDSTRPEKSVPFPKRIIIFSPHPDDDVISMGGTFLRLVDQGHDVHVAYQTSGNIAVSDDVVRQNLDMIRECGFGNHYDEIEKIIKSKKKGEPEPRELLQLKGAIRRSEARAACCEIGLQPDTHAHFLNLPFYETGGITKGEVTDKDINIIVELLQSVKPHRIFAAGDLSDPHGTHRVCFEALLQAVEKVKNEKWLADCRLWMYRGAWQEWSLDMADMAVPLSPEEVLRKRHAIYRHLSQKDIVPFPGDDAREFWQRAEERNAHTAQMYNKIGMAEYQAIEVFVRLF
ncbi:putative glucosamine-6-phosphate deaminase-like protein [Bacteroidia bacterium]|nr:putative glucosamine-6-phosphate deaminase-like protein [Bacteroidia bacterium]